MSTDSPTVSRLDYSPKVKLVNAACRVSETIGLPLGKLDAQSMLASARRSTGLTDWGSDDFIEPMEMLCEAARGLELTPFAKVFLRQAWIKGVQNRLQRTAWLDRHPEVLQTPVERPLFVLGFPRTGTTLLQHLLAEHPDRRGLRFWELTTPVPVHEDRELDRERRRRATKAILWAAYQVAPEMGAVHYIGTDTLEECWPLFGTSFAVMNYDLQSGARQYGDFLMNEWDMVGPYQEYQSFLKILVDRSPVNQLVLKCPEHLWFIDALLEVFPDACIVWTHRNPYDTVASYCSLMSLQWRTLYGTIDRERIGAYMADRLHGGIQRAMEAYQRADPDRFHIVKFPDLVADPIKVTGELSDHFGFTMPDSFVAGVEAHLDKKRADSRGQHKYDGSLYGLDRKALHDQFSDYIEAFDVPVRD